MAHGLRPDRFARVPRPSTANLVGRESDLTRIDEPVLILWGEEPVYPPSVAERLNDVMPSSTLGLLPACGHFLVEEAIDTIAPMIAEYLRALSAHVPHGHDDPTEGIVMLQLERRPPGSIWRTMSSTIGSVSRTTRRGRGRCTST